MDNPTILAIDTSCDETCAAVSYGRQILSNVISSQINLHAPYGGVVPHLAKRAHQDKVNWVVKKAINSGRKHANFPRAAAHLIQSDRCEHGKISYAESINYLDAIAVTIGPGLAPALEVGIAFAKNLALKLKKPLIAINHMEGHLLSALAQAKQNDARLLAEPKFPALGLLASGGHTQLVLVKSIGKYQLLGETLDDACGEALDKLAKMLKLGYPGGPIIEELAKLGNPEVIKLPIPLQHSLDLNFSFSGLKTAALYITQKCYKGRTFVTNMCASFQAAIAKSLTVKLQKAIEQYQPKSILLGGGVFSNLYFRRQIRLVAKQRSLPLYLPYSKKLFTDNAAMICIPAYYKFLKKDFVHNIATLDRQPNLNFANRL